MALADIEAEIPRTFFHILGGLFLAGIGFAVHPPLNRILLAVIFAVSLGVEIIRLLSPRMNDLAKALIGCFMRSCEERGLSGAPAFTGGIFLTFLLFRPEVALGALVPLIFGDRAGFIIGKSMGRIRLKGKTLEGSLACFGVSFIAYGVLSRIWPKMFGYGWGLLLGASLVGALAEALPRPFDDNLTIPLAVGLFLTIVT